MIGNFLQSRTSTGYFSNSTGSFVTKCRSPRSLILTFTFPAQQIFMMNLAASFICERYKDPLMATFPCVSNI